MGFKFLSYAEFEALSPQAKLAYLSDAMEELERIKVPKDARTWDSLFKPSQESPGDETGVDG